MKLLPFGDSHSYFWGCQKNYPGESLDVNVPIMGWLGPAKAYGLSNQTQNDTENKFKSILPILCQTEVVPIACFGEIDIRVNCAKNFLFTGSEKIIDELVEGYLSKISLLTNPFVCIWGPPPSAPDNGLFNVDLPAYGDNQVRNYLTHLFNRSVIREINNYPNLSFITFFYDLIDSNLRTMPGALHDGCHMRVDLQPNAKQCLINSITNGTKATLNYEKFQNIGKFSRVFKKIVNREKTPYLNLYKDSKNLVPEYFSYSPILNGSNEAVFSALSPI